MKRLLLFVGLLAGLVSQAQNPIAQPAPEAFGKWISVGSYTTATLPAASACQRCMAYNADSSNFGFSNGTIWIYYGSGSGATSASWGNIKDTIGKQTDLINLLNGKLAKADTSTMLAPYLQSIYGLKYADSGSMLAPYLRTISFTKGNIGLGNVLNRPQVINAGGWDSVGAGAFAAIPSPSTGPQFYYASDTNAFYHTNGTSYVKVGGGSGSGGTGADSSLFVTKTYGAGHYYPLSGNPSNFLTGITSGMINTALGYSPYPATNPNGYLLANQSITLTGGGDVTGAASGSTSLTPTFTVVGLRGAVLPSLSNGLLRNTSGVWSFDNNTYLTSASIAGKVNVTDTAAMLAVYLRSNVAAATYATITADALKLLKSDTAAMLAAYLRKQDTAAMLAVYLRSNVAAATYATITADALKLLKSDTAGMLAAYLRKQDTAAMLAHYTRTNDSRLAPTISVTPAPTNVLIGISSGTGNTMPIATSTNAGAMGPGDRKWSDSLHTLSDSIRMFLKPGTSSGDSVFLCTTPLTTATETCSYQYLNAAGSSALVATGDVTGTASGGAIVLTGKVVNSSVGTYGDASHVAQTTYDAQGRATLVTAVAISVANTNLGNNPLSDGVQILSSTGSLTKVGGATELLAGVALPGQIKRLDSTVVGYNIRETVRGIASDSLIRSLLSSGPGDPDSAGWRGIALLSGVGIDVTDSSDGATIIKKLSLNTSVTELIANKSTNTSLGTSNTLYPTQNAVKAYTDGQMTGFNSSATTLTNKTINGASNTLLGISLTTSVSGVLPSANGGLGAASLTGYLYGNAASAVTASTTIPGAAILGNIPGFSANITGIASIANGGTGQSTAAAALAALGGAPAVAYQWGATGNDIYNLNTGNIGFGTAGAPSQAFHFKKSQNAPSILLLENLQGGTTASTAVETSNGTYNVQNGIYSVGMTSYGTLLPNSGYAYTQSPAGYNVFVDANAPFIISTGTGTPAPERARVTGAGSLLINTTTDDGTKFFLNGAMKMNKDSAAINAAASANIMVLDTITKKIGRLPPGFLIPQAQNWSNTNLTATADRSFNGGGHGITFTNVSELVLGTLTQMGPTSLNLTDYSDANITISVNPSTSGIIHRLGTVTGNRTITMSSVGTGGFWMILNTNTSGTFHWSFATTVKDLAGNTITTLTNGTPYYIMQGTAGDFYKIN